MLRTQGYLRVKEAAATPGRVAQYGQGLGGRRQDPRVPASRQPLPDVQAGRPGAGQPADRTLGHAAHAGPTAQASPLTTKIYEPATPAARPTMSTARNWTTVTESKYPWERDALEFVRQRFPPTSRTGPGPTSSSSPTTAASTRWTCCCSRHRASSSSRSRAARAGSAAMRAPGPGRPRAGSPRWTAP